MSRVIALCGLEIVTFITYTDKATEAGLYQGIDWAAVWVSARVRKHAEEHISV
jgi:hypothetical protein